MITNFVNKTAVLTGGGSGFGLECARIGAKLGMNIVLVDVQTAWASRTVSGLSSMKCVRLKALTSGSLCSGLSTAITAPVRERPNCLANCLSASSVCCWTRGPLRLVM